MAGPLFPRHLGRSFPAKRLGDLAKPSHCAVTPHQDTQWTQAVLLRGWDTADSGVADALETQLTTQMELAAGQSALARWVCLTSSPPLCRIYPVFIPPLTG